MTQNNENIYMLFTYLRNHEDEKFKELFNTDKTVDINIKDIHNNFLLTYAVRFNKIDIVKLLLDSGANYDIVDSYGRSILYDATESNFYDIVSMLLLYSSKNIGVSITDIRDINGNIPLHYAIKLKNNEITKLLLETNSDPYVNNIDGYNSLHLAVKTGNIVIIKSILGKMSSVNFKTLKGESALHIAINYFNNIDIVNILLEHDADPNIIDNENGFTPLHYAVGWNKIEIIEKLMYFGADPNIQDVYGNVPLIYTIIENYVDCFNKIINFYSSPTSKIKINYNTWNVYGKILLHEVLENYNEEKKIYVDLLIENSNLSLQDNNGYTCLHYLIKFNIWKNYINIIKNKKINIFAKNNLGYAVIDLIINLDKHNIPKNNSYELFLDMTVSGYIYTLKKEKKLWKNELDKICSRDLSELTNDEKEYIIKNIDNKEDINNSCNILIKNKLRDDIKKYRENKIEYCQRSYPVEDKTEITINEDVLLDVCTFTGSLLDILIGLMFLIKKHNNVCTTIGKNINNNNEELCKFYKTMGLIMNGRCELINFEIVWINFKLYMIDNFSELFNLCVNTNARFIIIPLGIELKNGSHANYLIYDKNIKEIERFEPHGGMTPYGFDYNSTQLDNVLSNYFLSIDKDIKYIRPNEYIPAIGFQIIDSQEDKKKRIGDPGGFCSLWCIWYVDQRLTYYKYDRKTLIDELFENIKTRNISYKNIIRNYSANIIKERDKLFKYINIDINDWLNENYTYTQLDNFIELLKKEINKCCVVSKIK